MDPSSRSSTRRYLKGEQTRDQILLAAKKLFTQRGYHNTSIYDLFELAGITKGAFYHHWKTKEDLALTILDEMRAAYQRHLFTTLEANGRAKEQIEQTLRTIMELNANPEWLYCKLMATWSTELGPSDQVLGNAVHEMRQEWRAFWQALLQRAQEQGDLRQDIPPNELSFLVVSTICGVFLTEEHGACQDGQRQAMDTLRKLLFSGS